MQMHKELAEYLGRRGAARFDWGRANCIHFTGGWVRHVEGWDPLPDLAHLVTQRDAMRELRAHGGMVAAVSNALCRSFVPSALARLGDVVALPLARGRFSLGICNGRTLIVVTPGGAIAHVEMPTGAPAWRVGGAE